MRFDDMNTPTMETNSRCPKCSSDNAMFHPNRKFYCCDDCKHEFTLTRSVAPLRIFLIAAQFCESDKPDHRDAPRVIRSLATGLSIEMKSRSGDPELAKIGIPRQAWQDTTPRSRLLTEVRP
jgi:hypothetical protein